jgi:hypothetical protein
MTDWATISSLATAGGTLVLAVATYASVDSFRPQTRDLYIAPGDTGFWQAAIRDPADRDYAGLRGAAGARRPFFVQLPYADHDGGQRTISLFVLSPRGDSGWLCSVGRHRYLDRA